MKALLIICCFWSTVRGHVEESHGGFFDTVSGVFNDYATYSKDVLTDFAASSYEGAVGTCSFFSSPEVRLQMYQVGINYLVAPRLPPISPIDVLEKDYVNLCLHASEWIYLSQEQSINQLIEYLTENPRESNPDSDAITKIASDLLNGVTDAAQGVLIDLAVKIMIRRVILPKATVFLVRILSKHGSSFLATKVFTSLADTIKTIKDPEAIKYAGFLIHEKVSPDIFLSYYKIKGHALPASFAKDYFMRISAFQNQQTFLRHYRIFLQTLYPLATRKILNDIKKNAVKHPRRLAYLEWAPVKDAIIDFLNNPEADDGIENVLKSISAASEKYDVKESYGILDWYLGVSGLMKAYLKQPQDEHVKELFHSILSAVYFENNIKTAVGQNSQNMLWFHLNEADNIDSSIIELVADFGTPSTVSAVLAYRKKISISPNFTDTIAIELGEKVHAKAFIPNTYRTLQLPVFKKTFYSEFSPALNDRSSEIKGIIWKIMETIEDLPVVVVDGMCGDYGSPVKQTLKLDLQWIKHDMTEELQELVFTFVEIAFKIPRCELSSLDDLLELTSFEDCIEALLFKYCGSTGKRNVVKIERLEPLPQPLWLRNIKQIDN